MKPSLEKLQKFLRLEAERGFDNRAVVGGLERMLDRWQADAHADAIPNDLIQFIADRLRNYTSLSAVSRAENLEGIWKRIERVTGETLPKLPKPQDDAPSALEPERSLEQEAKIIPSTPNRLTGSEKAFTEKRFPSKLPKNSLTVDSLPAALNAPITVLPGVGPRHGQTLSRLGLNTLGDLLYYFPRRYIDYSELKPINRLWYGEEVTVIGMVEDVTQRQIRNGRMQIIEAVVSDSSGSLRITWFNQPWLMKRLRKGTLVSLSGKIEQYLGRLVMNNPEFEALEREQISTNRIVPVYGLTANITQRWIRTIMYQVITYWPPRVTDPIPTRILERAELVDLSTALLHIHFPETWSHLAMARHRLAFDEIFLLQLGVLRQKRSWNEQTARQFSVEDDWLANFIGRLPYQLTNAQQRAIQDIRSDLTSGHPMNRLLQGDVGSGKTIIAAVAMAILARRGVQSALMAPTSILAEQHYNNLIDVLCCDEKQAPEENPNFANLQPDELCLLLGSTPEGDKRLIREGLESGKIKIVIGTHALIEDPIQFSDLQLAVIDEQHRFGVQQRARLRLKGENPHLLVMTATPIPRSLALTVYGDLDVTVLDEIPPGRQPVQTQVFLPSERERAYSFIRSQVREGRQAFIIYPLVEESDKSDAKAAVEEYDRLQKEIFPDLKIGLVHGRLNPEEKEAVMARLRDGDLDILVSTSVVEVGVDIPNATVMLIDGANRFGLAQLHQFRGRVGRGKDQAYCILIPETVDAAENERLAAMVETNDGFILAERDLAQRGPGSFLGTRQSGYQAELRLASLTDIQLIEHARLHAHQLFDDDPELQNQEHQPIAAALARFWGEGQGDIS
jgi:ATP-dependent DNA helicase RecG